MNTVPFWANCVATHALFDDSVFVFEGFFVFVSSTHVVFGFVFLSVILASLFFW